MLAKRVETRYTRTGAQTYRGATVSKVDLRGNGRRDPRELPAYRLVEAARYLRLPSRTLRNWLVGWDYPTQGGPRSSVRLIEPASSQPLLLSFVNLTEAHVLAAIRRKHNLSLHAVRKSLDYLTRKHPSSHPLIDQQFETDGVSLFVDFYGNLENISQEGQTEIRECVKAYLERIERDPAGIPIKLYPYTRDGDEPQPRSVVIDPRVAFGRPVLAGTGISTAVVAERFDAGEALADLASDYGRRQEEIEEAIRVERHLRAAA